MKKLFLLLSIPFLLSSCVINHPSPEECEVLEITVTSVFEGSSNDIVIKDNGTDYFYINQGLKNGLSVEGLTNKLLNKKVTLHLPKYWIGTSEHIAQLAVNDEVIFTEFE